MLLHGGSALLNNVKDVTAFENRDRMMFIARRALTRDGALFFVRFCSLTGN